MIKCTFENNGSALLRHVAVHAIAIQQNKILLVKRAPQLSNGNKYAFPGGFLDRDETTAQGALRELKEETGYDGKIISLFSIVDNPNRLGEDRQNIAFSYLIEIGEKTGKADDESSEVIWIDLDNLPSAEKFAFDHLQHIQLCKDYLANKTEVHLPIILSN